MGADLVLVAIAGLASGVVVFVVAFAWGVAAGLTLARRRDPS